MNPTVLRQGLGALCLAGSVLRGTNRELFEAVVPAPFAKHNDQIQDVLTVLLAVLGVSFLIPRLRLVSRWGATAVMVGMLPAAIEQLRDAKAPVSPRVAAQIPAQLLLIVLAWVATQPSPTT